MYKAAAIAIADVAHHEEVVPSLLDPKVHLEVTHSVAKAAMESGVAKRPLDDDYFEDNTLAAPLWE
jgi:malic enzyme